MANVNIEISRQHEGTDSRGDEIEMSLIGSSQTCQIDPQPDVCAYHEQRFREQMNIHSITENYSNIYVGFQAVYILMSLARFQDLFNTIIYPQEALSNTACWYLDVALAFIEYLSAHEQFTWESAAKFLRDKHVITGEHTNQVQISHYLIFCLAGAMSCLYQAAEPEGHDDYFWRRFPIRSACPLTHHWYWCYFSSDLDNISLHRPVCDVLASFGEMLPLMDKNGRSHVDEDYLLDPSRLNARVILKTLKMKIVWTDLLGAHLDYDPNTNTIFLFRQAALCLLSAVAQIGSPTVLHRCIVDGIADETKLQDLMREILLSLHVIYGQDPKSRRIFDETKPFKDIPAARHDGMLRSVCCGPWGFTDFNHQPKRVYNLKVDFPILGAKLQSLSEHVRLQEPRTLRQIWNDKRNTLQWWTFWAVIIFGAVATALGVAQTVLAALQTYYASMDSAN